MSDPLLQVSVGHTEDKSGIVLIYRLISPGAGLSQTIMVLPPALAREVAAKLERAVADVPRIQIVAPDSVPPVNGGRS